MITNQALWQSWQEKNKDFYGVCCINVARRAMEILDEDLTPLQGYYPDVHTPHGIICRADDDIGAGGITGFMASCVESIIIHCHSRGEEFKVNEK